MKNDVIAAVLVADPTWVVDWNFQISVTVMLCPFVAPYLGAWIEITMLKFKVSIYNYKSHPTWVRGLKYASDGLGPDPSQGIAPYLGAWIEIWKPAKSGGHTHVAPYLGAWIEILKK